MADFCYNLRTDEAALTAPPALTTQPIGAVAMADESLNPPVEIWKPVVGFPGYEVSSYGRVRSFKRRSVRVLTATPYCRSSTKGARRLAACSVNLSRDKKCITQRVHVLVLEAFVGRRPPGMEGCHEDGNVLNNRLDNLRWDTRQANTADSVRHGTHHGGRHLRRVGEDNPKSRLREADVRAIRSHSGSRRLIAEQYGISRSMVTRIRKRINWKHVE